MKMPLCFGFAVGSVVLGAVWASGGNWRMVAVNAILGGSAFAFWAVMNICDAIKKRTTK